MKTKIFIPLVLVTTLLGGYPSPQDVRANPSVLMAQSIWKPFSSPEGGFRVLMPGTPIPEKTTINTPQGSVPIQKFSVFRENEALYQVLYPDLAVEVNSIPEFVNGFVTGTGGRLISQRNVSLGNFPGREIRLQLEQDLIGIGRLYFVNKRVYIVMVITNKEKSLTKSINGFLNSFQLLNNGRNPAIAQQPSLQELGNSLKQAVCSQNWSQALKIADQMIAIAPNAQTRRQLTDYRSQIQALARTGTKVPSSSLPDCGGRR